MRLVDIADQIGSKGRNPSISRRRNKRLAFFVTLALGLLMELSPQGRHVGTAFAERIMTSGRSPCIIDDESCRGQPSLLLRRIRGHFLDPAGVRGGERGGSDSVQEHAEEHR
jgi:hypothetical protein